MDFFSSLGCPKGEPENQPKKIQDSGLMKIQKGVSQIQEMQPQFIVNVDIQASCCTASDTAAILQQYCTCIFDIGKMTSLDWTVTLFCPLLGLVISNAKGMAPIKVLLRARESKTLGKNF